MWSKMLIILISIFIIIINITSAANFPVGSAKLNNKNGTIREKFRRFNTRMIKNLHKDFHNVNSNMDEHINATLDDHQLLDVFCPVGQSSFVRFARTTIAGIPAEMKMMELGDCIRYCRNNLLQSTSKSEPTICKGFNYQDTSTPTCEFFDSQTKIGPLNGDAGSSAFYYEKICLKEMQDSCRRRSFAFESVQNAELKMNVLKQLTVVDELSCLDACIAERSFVCQSVNYLADSNLCELSQFSRRLRPRDFHQDVTGVTYYESNCLTKTTRCANGEVYFTKNVNSEIEMTENKRNESLRICLNKCLEANSIFCRSVEFNSEKEECFISDDDSYSSPEILTLANSIAVDLYEPICLAKTVGDNIQCDRSYLFERYSNSALNVLHSLRTLLSSVLEDCLLLCIKHPLCKSVNYDRKASTCWLFQLDQRNTSNQLIVALDVDYYENNCQDSKKDRNGDQHTNFVKQHVSSVLSSSPIPEEFNSSITNSNIDEPGTFQTNSSDREVAIQQSSPKLLTEYLTVSALCTEQGVNITIKSSQTYTGAIYAAERFTFCRNLVFSQSSFYLFLPRPSKNTACNTVFVNNQLTGVVVISNDNITPYDVTTKDDLFYQVTCDYSTISDQNGSIIVTSGGFIVGGPTPRMVANVAFANNFEANLRILLNDTPVTNVLMGEQLTLTVESNVDISRVTVMNCNVTRVGGTGTAPEPLVIFDNGCPQIPQIFGPFQRGAKNLSATMTAFRIDGSAEIQLACLIMICPNACEPVTCGDNDGDKYLSFGRKKRKTELHMDSIDTNANLMETINGKLHVYVEGEYGADEILKDRIIQSTCIQQSTFVVVTVFLSALILLFLIASCVIIQRVTLTTLLHQKLLKNDNCKM